MTLVAVREQFAKISGRYDLVVDTTDWADNGADFYINAGQDWLDRRANIGSKSYSRVFETLAADDWYALFERCRAIKDVWCSDGDEKWKLSKIDFDVIRAAYADIPTNIDTDSPLYYSPIFLRRTPETSGTITIDFFGTTEFKDETKDHYTYNGLLFMPPSDGDYKLEIHGLFYHPILSADADTNYWTETHPLVLVMASCRALEVTYRNKTGIKDWEYSIDSELFGLDKDSVEEEYPDDSEMEG